jgi:hypothetical protein
MAKAINDQLQELAALWVDASPESFERISLLCGEMEQAAATGAVEQRVDQGVDRVLLRRAELLAIKAEKRLAECLTILTRTGSYSTAGALEVSERVATSGWEG